MDIYDQNRLALDDLFVGQKFTSTEYQLDAESIKEFAGLYDPQPFHTDETLAKDTFFQGLAASGWQTAGITMRLIVSCLPILGGLIGAGGEVAWPKATRPGDRLHVEVEIVDIRHSRSQPDRGIVTMHGVTLNQNGEVVQTLTSKLVVPKRTAQAKA